MKTIALTITTLGLLTVVACAQGLPVRVSVEEKSDVKRVVKQRASSIDRGGWTENRPEIIERTQKQTLLIKILNTTTTPLTGIVVKYTLVAKGASQKDLVIMGTGERHSDLTGLQTLNFTTEPFTTVVTETKDIDGDWNSTSGMKYYGCVVTVEQGSKKFVYANPTDLPEALKASAPPTPTKDRPF